MTGGWHANRGSGTKATTGQGTFKASAVTRPNGRFTMYLVPGEWTFSAIGHDEFGPDVPSTAVDVGKGGATDIEVRCGPTPAAMSTLVVG